MSALRSNSGFASVIAVFAIALVVSSVIGVAAYKASTKKTTPSPSPSVSVSATPTATPSPTPTTLPTPKPSTAPSSTPKAAVSAPTAVAPPSSGHGKITVKTDRGDFIIDVITLDASAQMVTDTADDTNCADSCKTLPLSDFVARNGGYAGINGSYFCPNTYPDCQSKKDSYDFPVYNSRLGKWINEDKLGWDGRTIIYKDGGGVHYMQNAKDFHGSLTAGVVNYPGILNGGHITVEAPSLSAKQSAKGTKGGIGYGPGKIYLVIAYNADMYDFAQIFKAIGATHALNLDGGGSSALYYNGYKVGPGRNLPNAIVFK